MFTGIITAMAKVLTLSPGKGGLELIIDKPKGFIGAQEGDSVAINGVCLTVKTHNGSLVFDVIPETLNRSNLKQLEKGEQVNVEPSLRVGDFVGGHMVYGHVDATCTIVSKDPEGQGFRLWCTTPPTLRNLIVEKGYVSLDGTSLTVAEVK